MPGNVKVLTTDIYLDMKENVPPDLGYSSAFSIVLLLLAGLLIGLYSRISRHASRYHRSPGAFARQFDLGRARHLGGGIILFNFLLILLTPTMGLVWLALMPFTQGVSRRGFALVTVDNFRTVLHSTFYVDLVWQTLLMSAGAATCVMALTMVAGWLAVRRRPGAWLLDQLATAPLIFPGIVLGVAMIQIYLSVPVAIYGTLWAFIIAFTIRFLPYGMRYAASGILQIHPELEEAAAIAGSSLAHGVAAHRRAAGDAGAAGRLAVHLSRRRARSFARRDPRFADGAAGVGGDVRSVGQRPGHRARRLRPGLDGDHDGDRRGLLSRRAAEPSRRRCAPDFREWTLDLTESKKKVEALTAPRNAVLVGASDRPGSWAARVWRNLNRYEFRVRST